MNRHEKIFTISQSLENSIPNFLLIFYFKKIIDEGLIIKERGRELRMKGVKLNEKLKFICCYKYFISLNGGI